MFTYMARSITNSLLSERPEVYVLEEDVVRVCRHIEPEKGQDPVASKLIRKAFDKYARTHNKRAVGYESSASAQFNADDVDPICEQIHCCTLATIADEKKNKADDADEEEEECEDEEEEEELELDAKLVALLTGVFLPPIWYIWYYGLE